MAVTKYSYNKLCDSARLSQEIASSAIVTAEDHIETSSAPATHVFMKDALSSGDEATLDQLVADHVNTPLPENEVLIVSLDGPADTDGSQIVRPKVTQTGWHFEPRCLTWTTSTHKSMFNEDIDGADIGDAVIKFFSGSGEITQGELSDETFQALLDTDCIRTIMDFYPTYDMEVIAGSFCKLNDPANPAWAWVTIAPDIPAMYGGSVPFLNGGYPLHIYPAGERIPLDGRGSKMLAYDPVYASNKTRVTIKHAAGEKITLTAMYDHFKA